MRRAIIDNATLTAVQRLLGEIPVYDLYSLDGDILAYETLIQTILFFDEIYYIDDYKEKYKTQREKFFFYLDGISIEEENYKKILDQTKSQTQKIIPIVKAGTFEDEYFKPFFELLKMNNIFTWDLSSSEFYLVHKMLKTNNSNIDESTFSKMKQMIFAEGLDELEKEKNPRRILIDSSGNEIYSNKDEQGNMRYNAIAKQTEYFLANLSWLAFRTIFYTIATKHLGGTLVLNPIRDAFQISYLNKINIDFRDTYRNIVTAMNMKVDSTINAIFNPTQPLIAKYVLPLFSVAITRKTNNPIETINVALNMRLEGDFIEARRKLSEIELLFAEEKNVKARIAANKLLSEVESVMRRLGEKYYINTPQGISLSPLIQIYNMGSAIPNSIASPLPDFTPQIKSLNGLKDLIPQRGFNAIYKSVINELANISKIGKYHEMLTGKVVYDDRANYYTTKIEEEKYKNVRCFWKIPM